jgi:subfamily B ATP-binding cassette protein MsbA
MFAFLFKIWALARPYRFRLWLGVFTGIIAGFIEPMMIGTVALVYEIIFSPPDSKIDEQLAKLNEHFAFLKDWVFQARDTLHHGVQAHPTAIIALVALIPGMMMLRGLFSYLNIYLLQWSAIRAITDLRIRLFDHMMNLPAGFFNVSRTGELIARILNDTLLLQSVISDATTTIVKDPSKVIALLVFLLWQQPKLTLVSMIVMPLCLIPILIYGRKTRKTAGNMQNLYADLTNVMAESFTSNRIIKAYNLEGTVVDQFRASARKLVGQTMRIVRSMETPGPLMETFGAIGVALVFLYLAARGGGMENMSAFIKVVGSIFLMYQPLKNLARLHNNLQQAQAASARVDELLATPNTVPEPAKPKPLKAAGADIEFKDVDFSFGEKPVLRKVNLTVKAGQFVALVGKTGSGKTTLTNLLLRFYDPQAGSVRIGGTDIREVATRDLRGQMAVVTQETVLFNQTIRRNIELGRPGATNADIEVAAKHAHATEFIVEKPEGFETVVGERGVTLSGGQRQRLAIARGILRDAPILVLDEATSALDTESERIVQAALEELMQGRTTICIAHRLSTIQKADVIVVFDEGRIVETGRHEELLKHDGIYRKLYELQFNG